MGYFRFHWSYNFRNAKKNNKGKKNSFERLKQAMQSLNVRKIEFIIVDINNIILKIQA